MNDLDLLRRHEPIVRFTAGELFYPCAVDDYVAQSSLWRRDRTGRSQCVVEYGQLDLDRLSEVAGVMDSQALYLRYVQQPLSPREYQQWRQRPDRVRFHAPARLARVPLWSRLLDSAFDVSLLIRGRVPGGTAAAAEIRYSDLLTKDARRVYYARVVRAGAWTVLHYMFFYAMNDWRSTFHGTNDHEADWEQIFVFLYETEAGSLAPRWVAYASHDYEGDDLRRRWDDPLLLKEGLHPVVFAAAGSHASYYEQGEYLMRVEPPFMRPVKRVAGAMRAFWVETLGQGRFEGVDRKVDALVNVPFVDYARGDGLVIGPDGGQPWTPVLISDDVPWVSQYRGLWGLETRDPFGGERAPAGPRYNRDGSERLSWFDPLGFAGLDKVVPPPQLAPGLEARQRALALELADLDDRIAQQRRTVQALAMDEEALRNTEPASVIHKNAVAELATAEADLDAWKHRRSLLAQTRETVQSYGERILAGAARQPEAHLRNVHRPDSTPPPRRVLQLWAALSGAIALFAVGALLLLSPAYWLLWVLAMALSFATVEAAAEGRLLNFLLSVAIVLALISALILIREFWRTLVVITLAVVIASVIRENIRELRGM